MHTSLDYCLQQAPRCKVITTTPMAPVPNVMAPQPGGSRDVDVVDLADDDDVAPMTPMAISRQVRMIVPSNGAQVGQVLAMRSSRNMF